VHVISQNISWPSSIHRHLFMLVSPEKNAIIWCVSEFEGKGPQTSKDWICVPHKFCHPLIAHLLSFILAALLRFYAEICTHVCQLKWMQSFWCISEFEGKSAHTSKDCGGLPHILCYHVKAHLLSFILAALLHLYAEICTHLCHLKRMQWFWCCSESEGKSPHAS